MVDKYTTRMWIRNVEDFKMEYELLALNFPSTFSQNQKNEDLSEFLKNDFLTIYAERNYVLSFRQLFHKI